MLVTSPLLVGQGLELCYEVAKGRTDWFRATLLKMSDGHTDKLNPSSKRFLSAEFGWFEFENGDPNCWFRLAATKYKCGNAMNSWRLSKAAATCPAIVKFLLNPKSSPPPKPPTSHNISPMQHSTAFDAVIAESTPASSVLPTTPRRTTAKHLQF